MTAGGNMRDLLQELKRLQGQAAAAPLLMKPGIAQEAVKVAGDLLSELVDKVERLESAQNSGGANV